MNYKYKKLLKDTLVFALGSIGSKCIMFLLVPLYTNYLTAEQYGVADLVFTVAQIFIPIISLVIFDAVIRFGLEKNNKPGNVLSAALFVWLCGCLVSVALMPLVGLYKSISEWKWYLYFYVVFNILLSIELNYLKVKNKNLLYSVICIIQTFVLAILNIILLIYVRAGVAGYLLSNILACLVVAIIAFLLGGIYQDLRKAVFDTKLLKRMIVFSAPLIFNNIAWWIIQSSDKVMIEYLVGTAELGLYTVATRMPSLVNVFVSVFQQSWGISAIVEIESETDNRDFYEHVFRYFTVSILGVSLFVNTIVKIFMKYYVGKEFYFAWRYVPLLIGAAAFSAIAAYFGSVYGALKKSFNNMLSTVLAGVMNIIINFILIPHIGVWGAVVGTIIAYGFLAIYRMIDCLRYISFKVNFVDLFINFIIMVIHAVFVSLDFYIIPVSIVTFVIYILINLSTIKGILQIKK